LFDPAGSRRMQVWFCRDCLRRQQGLAFFIEHGVAGMRMSVWIFFFSSHLKLFADGSRLSCVLGVDECVWPRGDSQSHASS